MHHTPTTADRFGGVPAVRHDPTTPPIARLHPTGPAGTCEPLSRDHRTEDTQPPRTYRDRSDRTPTVVRGVGPSHVGPDVLPGPRPAPIAPRRRAGLCRHHGHHPRRPGGDP